MTVSTHRLPWPPSVNRYWRSVGGRVLISADGRAYRDTVRALVLADRVTHGAARVRVTIEASPPDRRRRDLDNLLKAPLDALTHAGLWCDDEQIDALTITREPVQPGGRIIITVES